MNYSEPLEDCSNANVLTNEFFQFYQDKCELFTWTNPYFLAHSSHRNLPYK